MRSARIRPAHGPGPAVAGLAGRAAMTAEEIEYTEQGGTEPPSPCCGTWPPPWTPIPPDPGHDLGPVWFETHAA
jgi:hypothetical protein